MKKYFSNKQMTASLIALMSIILIIAALTSFGVQYIAYADSSFAESIDEVYYAASGSITKETENFTYATKTTESYSINPTFPDYFNANGALLNTCSNVAGANIIGYYDRYFDELIPDYTAGRLNKSNYIYFPMGYYAEKKQAVINDLYQRMKTNVNGEGNTQTEYKNGLSSYVQSKGLATTYYSVMTSGKFDLEKTKTQLQNGNPISLYMSGYNFTKVTDSGNSVTLEKSLFDGNHIAVAYGYEKVTYLNANGSVLRTEIYLKVSTGYDGITGVYVVNKYGTLNDAEAVHIA